MNDLLHVAGWRVCARLHAQDCHRARRLAARLHVQAAEKAAANGDLFAVCLMAIANWRLSGARRGADLDYLYENAFRLSGEQLAMGIRIALAATRRFGEATA